MENIALKILDVFKSILFFIFQGIISGIVVVFFLVTKILGRILGLVLIFTSILFVVAIVLTIIDVRQIMSGSAEFMHTKYYSMVIVFCCMHFSVFALAKIVFWIEDRLS